MKSKTQDCRNIRKTIVLKTELEDAGTSNSDRGFTKDLHQLHAVLGDSSEDWFDQLTRRSLQQKQARCQSEIFLSPQTPNLQVHKTGSPNKGDGALAHTVGSTPDIQWTQPRSISPFLCSQALTPSPSGWIHPILGSSPDIPIASQSRPVPTPLSRNTSQLIKSLGTSDSLISWTSSLATPGEIASAQKENLEMPVKSKVLARALFTPEQKCTDSEDLVQTLDSTLEEEDLHENVTGKIEDEKQIFCKETEELCSIAHEYGSVESERKAFELYFEKENEEEIVFGTENCRFVKKTDLRKDDCKGNNYIRDQVKAQPEVKEHDLGDQIKQEWGKKDGTGISVSHVQPEGKIDAPVIIEQEENSMPLFSQDMPSPTLGRSKTLRTKINFQPCVTQVEMGTTSIEVKDSSIIETLSEFFDPPSCIIKRRRLAPSRGKKRKSEEVENLDLSKAELENVNYKNIKEKTSMPHSILSSRKKQNGASKTKRVRFSEDCTQGYKPKENNHDIYSDSLKPELSHYTNDFSLRCSLSETGPFNSNLKENQANVEKKTLNGVQNDRTTPNGIKGKSRGDTGDISDSLCPILSLHEATIKGNDDSFVVHMAAKSIPGKKSEEGIQSLRPKINCNYSEEIFSQISPAVLDEMCSVAQLPHLSPDSAEHLDTSPHKSSCSLSSSKVEKKIESGPSNKSLSIPNQLNEADTNNISKANCSNFDEVAEEKTSISPVLKSFNPHRWPRLSRSKARQFLYPTASQIDASCPRKVYVFQDGKANLTRPSSNRPRNKEANSKRILPIKTDDQEEVKKDASAQSVESIKQDGVAESETKGSLGFSTFSTCSESTDASHVLCKPEPSIVAVHQTVCEAESRMKRSHTSPALKIPVATERQVELQPDKDSITSLDSYKRRSYMEAKVGFQTAGGGKISMSRSALNKAEKLLIESVEDTPAPVCKDELMTYDEEWTEDSFAKPHWDEESSLIAFTEDQEIKKKEAISDTHDVQSKELTITRDVLEASQLSIQRGSESLDLGELELGSKGDQIKVSQKGSDSVHDEESKKGSQSPHDEIKLPRTVESFSDLPVEGFKSASGKDISLNNIFLEKVEKVLMDKWEDNEEKESVLINLNNYSTLKMPMPSKAICAGTEALKNAQRVLSSSSCKGLPMKSKNYQLRSNTNKKLSEEMESSAESPIIAVDKDSVFKAQKLLSVENVPISHGRMNSQISVGVGAILKAQKLFSERYPHHLPYQVDQNTEEAKSIASPDNLVQECKFDKLSCINGLQSDPRSVEKTASLCKADIGSEDVTKVDESIGIFTTGGTTTTQGVASIDRTESLYSDEETVRHSVAESHSPKTLPDIMSRRYQGSFLPSSNQPVGFCTPGGKKLAMSDASLFKAVKLFSDANSETISELPMDNIDKQRESVRFHTVHSMERSCGKTSCVQATKVPEGVRDKISRSATEDINYLNECMGFQSASGKNLSANEMTLSKARNPMKEDRDVAESTSVDLPSENQFVVFSTAGGKRLAASEAAFSKAKTLLSDDPSSEIIAESSSTTSLNISESTALLTIPFLNTVSCSGDGDSRQDGERSDGVDDVLEELLSWRSKVNESGDTGRLKCNTAIHTFSPGSNVPQGFRPFKPPRRIAPTVSEVGKEGSNSVVEKSHETTNSGFRNGSTDVSAFSRNTVLKESSNYGKKVSHSCSRNLKTDANHISTSRFVCMMSSDKQRSDTAMMDGKDGKGTISKDTEKHICGEDKKSNDNLMDQIFADELESSQMFSPRSGKVITDLRKELESHPQQSEGYANHIKDVHFQSEQHSSSKELISVLVDMKPEDFDVDMNDLEEHLSDVDLECLQTRTDGQMSQSVLEQKNMKTSPHTLSKSTCSKCVMCEAVQANSVLESDASSEVLCSDCSDETNHMEGIESLDTERSKDVSLNKLSKNDAGATFDTNKTSISPSIVNSNVLMEDSALYFSQTGGSKTQDRKNADIKLQNSAALNNKSCTMVHSHNVVSTHVQILNMAVIHNQSQSETLTQIPDKNELVSFNQNQNEAVAHIKNKNEAVAHINRDIETVCQSHTEGRLKIDGNDNHLESDLLDPFFGSQFDFTDADPAHESCMADVLLMQNFGGTSNLDSYISNTASSRHSQEVTVCNNLNESPASSSKDKSSAVHQSASQRSSCAVMFMDMESNIKLPSGKRSLLTGGKFCISENAVSHAKQIHDSSELQRGNGLFFQTASGRDVNVSEKALSYANQILDSSELQHENEFLFKTAGGKTVCVSEKSLSHLKQTLDSAEIPSRNDSLFAGGKNVNVSEKALLQAKNITNSSKLYSEIGSLIETASGRDVLDSSDLLSGNESLFKTAGVKSVGVSKKVISHAKQTLNSSDLQGGNKSHDKNDSDKDADMENALSHAKLIFDLKEMPCVSGSFFEIAGGKSHAGKTLESIELQNEGAPLFQTAGGKSVSISAKALSHAKQILDSSNTDNENKSAFKTSGSKSVHFSENTSLNLRQNVSSKDSLFKIADEKSVSVSEKATDLESESECLFKTTGGKSINVSKRRLSYARQTHNSVEMESEGESLFITAGGKSVTTSKKALVHARQIHVLDSSKQQNGVESLFKTACGKSSNALKKDLVQCKETVDPIEVLSVGQSLFMTAGGKSVSMSAKALLHAKQILDSSSMEHDDVSAFKIADSISAKVSDKTLFPAVQTCDSIGSHCITVCEKSVSMTEKALLQARQTHDSLNQQIGSGPHFKTAVGKSVDMSHAKQIHDSSDLQTESGSLFQTAGGKSVSVSEKALAQAKQKLNSSDLQSESGTFFKTAGGKSVSVSEKAFAYAKQSFDSSDLQAGSESLFMTASGKSIDVSEKSLLQVRENFDFLGLQSDIEGGKSLIVSEKDLLKARQTPDSTDLQNESKSIFKTAVGMSVTVSEMSLMQTRQTLDSLDLQSESGSLFKTAGGKSVSITDTALTYARQTLDSLDLQSESGSLFKTAGGKSVSITDKALTYARQTLDSLDLQSESGSLFKTAGGKSVSITDKALTYARQTLDSLDLQSESGSLFKTAGGKSVSITDEALLLAKQTLDSSDVQCENSLFKTAGGKSVCVSDKVLLQARQTLDSSLLPSNIGTLFKTAGGQPVSVLEKNMSHAKQTLSSSLSDEVPDSDSRLHLLKDKSPAGIHSFEDCVPQEYLDSLAQMKENLNANSLKRKQETLDTDVKNENILSGGINYTGKTSPFLTGTRFTKKEDSCNFNRPFRLDGNEEKVTKGFEKPPRKRIRFEDSDSTFSVKKESDRMFPCKLQVSTPEGVLLDRRSASMHVLKPVYSKQHVKDLEKYSGSSLDVNKEQPDLNVRQKSSFKTPFKSSSSATAVTCSDAAVLKSGVKISAPVFKTKVQQRIKEENASHLSRQIDMECEPVSNIELAKEGTQCPLLDARRQQEEKITAKQKQFIRPVAGRLFQQKRNSGRIGLKDVIHFSLAKRTHQELITLGVNRSTLGVKASNAGEYRFILSDFYSAEVRHVLIGDGAYLVPDDSGTAGKQEFARAFQTLDGVDPKLVNDAWIYNHYRWIVWKLAAYEVVSPSSMAGRCLIPENVMLQLKYRYDVEIDKCHRSALKKIVERDDACGKRMILCVSGIENSQTVLKEGDQSKIEDSKGKSFNLDYNVMLELTDGWYCVKTKLDIPLADLVMKGRIQVGQKICITGAELVGSKEACTPLEIQDSLFLKICANSCRSAPWDSRLGFQREPSPLCVPLTGLYGEGGLVGAIDVVVVRKYPLMYMEKLHEGGCVFRNEIAEIRERQNHENQQQDNMERFYQNMEQQMEKEDKEERRCVAKRKWTRQEVAHLQTGQELYEAMLASLNPDSLEFLLSQQQMELLHEYRRQVQEERHCQVHEQLRKAWAEQQQDVKPRNVTPVLKFRIASCARRDLDNKITTVLTVWRPSSEIMAMEEGQRYRIYSLTASSPRSKYIGHDVQLTATKNTRYQRKKIDENFLDLVYEPREMLTVEELRRKPAYEEVDFVGMVVKVIKAAQAESGRTPDMVYCADYQGNVLGIKFWTGIKSHGVEDLLVEGRLVCISNLMDKSASNFRSLVVLLLEASTEFTSFTNQPQNSTQRMMLEKIQNACKDKKSFLAAAQERLEDLFERKQNLHSRITPQKNTTSTSSVDQSTPISRRELTEATPDMADTISSDNITKSIKRSIQQTKMAKLMSYGSPGVLSPLISHIPKSVSGGFKPPVFKGKNTPK